jgi:hypothetical protein
VRRNALLLLALAALAGCGGSGSNGTEQDTGLTVLHTPTTTATGPPKGPLVRVCDRALAAELTPILEAHEFRSGAELRPHAAGEGQLSACDLGPVELSLDAANDAAHRYRNRIAETAQFSEGIPSHVPRPVRGIGDPELGASGANWIPFRHQLLSARGERVLIVTINGGGQSDDQRLETAEAVSLAVWDRLA